MATTATTSATNGRVAPERARPVPGKAVAGGRRRQLPLVVVGVLLVVGCALAFAEVSLRSGGKEEVLVVDQPLATGQVLTPGDLHTARLSAGSGVQAVAASDEPAVVGHRVAVPLVAGALLTNGEIGSSSGAAASSDLVAVGLKAGSFPPSLAPGDRVRVVPVTTSSSSSGGTTTSATTTASASPVEAVVVGVQAASATSGSPTVFSLQVSKTNADEVASLSAAGDAVLVQVGD